MIPDEIETAVRELFPRVDRDALGEDIEAAASMVEGLGSRIPFTHNRKETQALRREIRAVIGELVTRAVYAYAHSRNLEAVSIDVDDEGRVPPFRGTWELRMRTTSGIVGSIAGPARSDRPPREVILPVMHELMPGIGYVRDPRTERLEISTTARFELYKVSPRGIAHYREVLDPERYGLR